ncbi:TPA: phage tail tape measure protein [Escherichia coli]
MAIVNELITKFGFIGNLAPQETFNANLKASIGLLAGLGAAIAGSAAGVAGWVTSVSQSIDPLVQFSRETGVAIETVQSLGYAASVNGSSVDALQASLGEMTKRVGEFVSTGEGEAKDVAERLGLQFKDMNGQVKNSDVIFRELADKLHGMSQAEKFSVLDKMGIDRSMVQLLSMTGEEISSLQNKAEALGVVTQDQADQFAAYNDSLTTLGKGFDGIKFQVAVGFVPVLKDLVDGFTDFLIANKDLIKNGLAHLGEIIFSVMGMIRRFLPIIGLITTGFVAWKIAAIGLRTVLATIFSPVVLITAAIIAVVLVIDDLLTAMEGGQSVIADFFKDTWGIDIVPGLLAIKDAVMVVVDYIIEVFKQGIENIKLLFSALSKLVTGDFQGAWDDVVKSFTESVALLRKPFDEFMQWVMGLFANLGETIKNTISNAASNAWNATKSFFGFGEDEQQQGVTGGGNGGMSPGGIPYGMNAAVGLGGDSSSYNNSYTFSQQNYITAPDAVAAGNAVADSTQQQQKDAKRMFSRNGK